MTAPVMIIPAVAIPAMTAPAVAIPAVAIPAVAIPAVAIPAVAIPAVAIPAMIVTHFSYWQSNESREKYYSKCETTGNQLPEKCWAPKKIGIPKLRNRCAIGVDLFNAKSNPRDARAAARSAVRSASLFRKSIDRTFSW